MTNLLSALQSRLSYTSARQQVLSDNIARAHIPKEKAFDLQLPKGSKSSMRMAVTSSLHMGTSGNEVQGFTKIQNTDTFDTNPNGNNIVLEEQMLQLAQNSSEFQLAGNMYKKIFSMLKTSVSSK